VNATGAVFQPELIELMKAVLDDATAMLPEAKRTSAIKAEVVSHSCVCRERRARSDDAENGCAPIRRGVHALFSRYLAGAPGSLSARSISTSS
jgi:hypothetical protein